MIGMISDEASERWDLTVINCENNEKWQIYAVLIHVCVYVGKSLPTFGHPGQIGHGPVCILIIYYLYCSQRKKQSQLYNITFLSSDMHSCVQFGLIC